MYIRIVSNINKWDGTENVPRPGTLVCGDAITDLKTTHNMLSIWKVTNDLQIDESIAAVALGRERLSKVSYVILEENEVEQELKLSIAVNEGKCRPIIEKSILERHRDIIQLDSRQLESLSAYMLERVQDSHNDDKDNEQIKEIVAAMIMQKKVDPTKINEKLKAELGV